MAQKGRNSLEQVVNDNVYDNSNKEILAKFLRDVFEDYRDSYFNLIDDRLANLLYEGNQTLRQKLNETTNATPFWGATQYFDPGSTSGNISGSSQGIITSINYEKLTSHDCQVTININPEKPISNKKLVVSVITQSSNMNQQNDLCVPVIRVISSTKVIVGLREVSTETQSIRLELFAFNVQS